MSRSDRRRRPITAWLALCWPLATLCLPLTTMSTALAFDEPMIDWQKAVFTEVVAPAGKTPATDEAIENAPLTPSDANPTGEAGDVPTGREWIPPAPPAAAAPLSPRRPDTAPAMDTPATEPAASDPFSRSPEKILRSLSEIRVSLDTPAEETLAEEEFEKRGTMTLATHTWPGQTPEAADYRFFCDPLWYEDANLERCGHSHGYLQPVVSGTHFVVTTALLPYRFVAEPPCQAEATKPFCPPGGHYRCRDNYLPPLDTGGSAAQALAITGLIFLIP